MEITLYTKDGCTLCDKLKDQLALIQAQYPHQLAEVDITKDEALFQKYRYTIPVLKSGNQEISAPIDKSKLVQFLIESS